MLGGAFSLQCHNRSAFVSGASGIGDFYHMANSLFPDDSHNITIWMPKLRLEMKKQGSAKQTTAYGSDSAKCFFSNTAYLKYLNNTPQRHKDRKINGRGRFTSYYESAAWGHPLSRRLNYSVHIIPLIQLHKEPHVCVCTLAHHTHGSSLCSCCEWFAKRSNE